MVDREQLMILSHNLADVAPWTLGQGPRGATRNEVSMASTGVANPLRGGGSETLKKPSRTFLSPAGLPSGERSFLIQRNVGREDC